MLFARSLLGAELVRAKAKVVVRINGAHRSEVVRGVVCGHTMWHIWRHGMCVGGLGVHHNVRPIYWHRVRANRRLPGSSSSSCEDCHRVPTL